MKVSTAIDSRMSCRAFLPTPVSESTVRTILETAKRAPSGGNLQPWHCHVRTGEPLACFLDLIGKRLAHHPRGEGAEYDVYPPGLTEPYRGRRYKCGEDMYATIDVVREDKPARLRQFARNYGFFGAPVGMFFCIDRQMGPPQWADLGMYMQSVMLLAREHGLHTCPQEAWASFSRTVSGFLALPDTMMLFCGIALGHADEAAAINFWRAPRAALAEFASFSGFAD